MSKQSQTRNAGADLDLKFERLATAQRNITPHEQLANGRSMDDALWNGFDKPKGIQKAGILVYSGFLFLLAVALMAIAFDRHDRSEEVVFSMMSLGVIAIAVKIASNAFRTRKKPSL